MKRKSDGSEEKQKYLREIQIKYLILENNNNNPEVLEDAFTT